MSIIMFVEKIAIGQLCSVRLLEMEMREREIGLTNVHLETIESTVMGNGISRGEMCT